MICLVVLVSLIVSVQELEAALSSCKANPCKNQAQCVEQPDTLYGYSCICPPNYRGINCDDFVWHQTRVDNIDTNSKSLSKQRCMNGGQLVKEGLPCRCPPKFSGTLCENYEGLPILNTDYCSPYPCMNGGTCRIVGGGFACTCIPGYSGSRCEYSRTRRTGNVLGASVGSSFSSLLLMAVVAFCIYQCCLKRGGTANQRPGGFPFSASFFNRGGGPPGGYARPMGPMGPVPMGPPGGGFPMQPRPGGPVPGGNMYPMQPPMQQYPSGPMPSQPGFYPNYQAPGGNQLYKPQDPDEVFRVNAAPPSYDEVTKTTSQPQSSSVTQPQTSLQHQSEANK